MSDWDWADEEADEVVPFLVGREAALKAVATALRAAEIRGMKEARDIVCLSAWKHEGDDTHSQGMDAGARHQVNAAVEAIDSHISFLNPKRELK